MGNDGLFWDDLTEDLDDPAFLREYISQSVRIATIDAIVNGLDDARRAAGLTKADLARAISAEPATVRRLLASPSPNPTLGTLAELAAVLGMRITLQPLANEDNEVLTEPLRRGKAVDKRALVERLHTLRISRKRASAPA